MKKLILAIWFFSSPALAANYASPTFNAVTANNLYISTPLPIISGGTGASNASSALVNLGALSTSAAASTYAPIASPTFTGTVTAPTLALSGSGSTGDISAMSITGTGGSTALTSG